MDEMLMESVLGADGVRSLHVVGGGPVREGWLDCVPDASRALAKVERWETAGLHHLRVTWPARELVVLSMYPGVRQMIMLWFVGDLRVSAAIKAATEAYALQIHRDPGYAWIRQIPKGAEEGVEVGHVMLIQADWVPAGFVAIGQGRSAPVPVEQVLAGRLA